MRRRLGWLLLGCCVIPWLLAAEPPAADDLLQNRAVMSGEQVIEILDETVDWYRTLGAQEQAATQPSDLLILYANRQTADKVMTLAFEIARANAELLSSEASAAKAREEQSASQSLDRSQKELNEQRAEIQTQIESVRRDLASASGTRRSDLQTRLSVLQGELDMINARRNMLSNMSQYASQTDTEGYGANALKAHIDAIAASIPTSTAPAALVKDVAKSEGTWLSAPAALAQFGIWDLTATVFRLSAKAHTIANIDDRTAKLQETFTEIRNPPMERLQALSERGDALAAQADAASGQNLRTFRDRYDTIAWLYQQTAAMVTPLSKAEVLLNQYRRNLSNWREATHKQYQEALAALGLRVALFAGLLGLVFVVAELWRRAVFRYVTDPRRRSRLLLLRKIIIWTLVVVIVLSTFATELGSLATFAGLITAGLAVAMQSVLVSVVGYFFLISKYGIRVGDRVQIGNVTGEVIELGLVRLHLMELSGQGAKIPTGRVVAFANSIIFQSSGGLFKQIPGVDLAWHETTLPLPAGADYAQLKDRLTAAVTNIIKDYRDDILRQSREIQKTAGSQQGGDPMPQVQLRFALAGVEALVRYPVQLSHAAEIDERVSRELLAVVSSYGEPVPAGA